MYKCKGPFWKEPYKERKKNTYLIHGRAMKMTTLDGSTSGRAINVLYGTCMYSGCVSVVQWCVCISGAMFLQSCICAAIVCVCLCVSDLDSS